MVRQLLSTGSATLCRSTRSWRRLSYPIFYDHRDRLVDIMRHAMAIDGSFFNIQRMLQQYVLHVYF